MKKSLVLSIVMGIGLLWFSNSVYAQTDEMFKKQGEVDQVLFEEKNDEIAQKGITITHTVALEDKVEISITPFLEENSNYIYELFGEENVVVVESEQVTTLAYGPGIADSGMAETEETSGSNSLYFIIGGVILVAAGFVIVLGKRRVKE